MSRYIDADKLKEILYITANFVDVKKVFERYIDKTPTEDVKPIVRGEWIDVGLYVYECSNCYNSLEMWWEDKYKFCPNCGANMRKEQQNDTN